MFLLGAGTWIFSQNLYDKCEDAFEILDISRWCSDHAGFSNLNASNENPTRDVPSCWSQAKHDVWFTFIAQATDINVVVSGDIPNNSGGTLKNPQITLSYGDCAGELISWKCESDIAGNNIIELNQSGLIIGERYLLRVDGVEDNVGSFTLCIRNFNPPVVAGQDCSTAAVLCDTTSFVVQSVSGAGQFPDEANNTCLGGLGINSEQQSVWYKWIAANDTTMIFTLTPLKADDDLDFVLYELPGGIDDCAGKVPIRCMATACLGPTGLDLTSNDLEEDLNCDPGEDGFIRFIEQEAGKAYALVINNFTTSGNGFAFEFGGGALIEGPEPDFEVVPDLDVACEDPLTVIDRSTFSNGSIVNWSWNFGKDALPLTAVGQGSHDMTYESFGSKYIILTVESDKGCIRTKIKKLEVDTCCGSLPDLTIAIDSIKDLTCFGIPTGVIQLSGSGGTMAGYRFSINNDRFRTINSFSNLDVGMYFLKIQDNHGCEDSTLVELFEPDPLMVNAGDDIQADLGYEVEFHAQFTPPFANVTSAWISSNGDSIVCLDPPECLSVQVLPPGSTDYIITIVDEAGCTDRDTVSARVAINRKLFYPNVFSPNGDGINDVFSFKANRSATGIEVLRVFDRWGGLVFEATDLPLNNESVGWDGRYKGEFMPVGVYTFVALIRFVDRKSLPYSGDITIVR